MSKILPGHGYSSEAKVSRAWGPAEAGFRKIVREIFPGGEIGAETGRNEGMSIGKAHPGCREVQVCSQGVGLCFHLGKSEEAGVAVAKLLEWHRVWAQGPHRGWLGAGMFCGLLSTNGWIFGSFAEGHHQANS